MSDKALTAAVTKWWWVRHAPVVDAHLMRLSGQNDVDADTSDREIFKSLARRLPSGAVWLTSNLVRTHQTLEALWQEGAPGGPYVGAQMEPAFAEQAFGDWTGYTWDQLGEMEEAKAFWTQPATVAPPGGPGRAESFADVCARVADRIDELTHEFSGRDIICVAHAGPIRAAVALALGLSAEQALGLDVGNVSLTRLDHMDDGQKIKRGGHWRVVGVNQIC